MKHPPRDPREPLFSLQMLGVSLALGASVLAAVCLAYGWAAGRGWPEGEVRSLGFAAIVFGNLAMIHATRSRDHPLLAALRLPNPALWWITVGTLAALAVAVYVPPAAELFRFAPLGPAGLAVAAGAGITGVLWYEAYKRLRPRAGAT
jgi:Ca2+-transporting ATPase